MAETKTETKKAAPAKKGPSVPEGWEIAHEGEGSVILSKLVDTPLGAQQRVSESGVDLAEATANAEAYDAHQAAVAEGREAEAAT